MNAPIPLESCPEHTLTDIERQLRTEEAYLRGDHAARTLAHAPDLRVVLVAFKAGGHLREHQAKATVSIHALSGLLRVSLPDRVAELPAGALLLVAQGVRHSVEAVGESAMLLTLGRPGQG